jgi:hypothetical protein
MQRCGSVDNSYGVLRPDKVTDRFFERGDKRSYRGNKTTIDALGEVVLLIPFKDRLMKAASLRPGYAPNSTDKVVEIIHEA